MKVSIEFNSIAINFERTMQVVCNNKHLRPYFIKAEEMEFVYFQVFIELKYEVKFMVKEQIISSFDQLSFLPNQIHKDFPSLIILNY